MWVIVRSVFGSVRPKYSNLASAFQDFGDEITWKLPGNLGEVGGKRGQVASKLVLDLSITKPLLPIPPQAINRFIVVCIWVREHVF